MTSGEQLKKEIGGIALPDGIVLGPMYFSKDGKQATTFMGPPVVAFDFGISNAINRLKNDATSIDEFQVEFNSLIENLIADILIYLQNRLKLIAAKNSVGQMNSIDKGVFEYKKFSINLGALCDLPFLTQLDRVRGAKHHSDRRYDTDYTIQDIAYDSVDKLRVLAQRVRSEIKKLDDELNKTHPAYDMKIAKQPGSVSIELNSIGHAFDLTKGRVVPNKTTPQQKNQSDKGKV